MKTRMDRVLTVLIVVATTTFSPLSPSPTTVRSVSARATSLPQGDRPLTLQQVEDLIRIPTPDFGLAVKIKERRISFSIDEATLDRLRQLGAGPLTIQALKDGNGSAASGSNGCFDRAFALIPKDRVMSIEVGLGSMDLFSREQSKDELVGITLKDSKSKLIGGITFTSKFTPNPASLRDDVVFKDVVLYDSQCTITGEYDNLTNPKNKPNLHSDNQIVLRLGGKQYWLIVAYNSDYKFINAELDDKRIKG